ncbi:hypothetical protein ABZS81_09220 [Streptomyces sp. NPDC005318]
MITARTAREAARAPGPAELVVDVVAPDATALRDRLHQGASPAEELS